MSKPIIAIVGRPNVGKSMLFNKIIGRRLSIVEDTPGVTRDRIYGESDWQGRKFTLIDTGGIEPRTDNQILAFMRSQAQIAIDNATVIVFLCDIKTGMTASDQEVASMLQRCGKPVVLAVNKVDQGQSPDIYEFYNLGLGDPIAVSAVHGHGTGDLLDACVQYFPPEDEEEEEDDAIKVAVIGKPNAGKSSLVNEVLFKRLGAELMRMKVRPGKCDRIEGMEQLDKVVNIDQSPIGRTPRSNPATYTGLFNDIRDLFASTQEAKSRGYGQGRFSFNVKGGRCEACQGDGIVKIEMHFLADIYVPCDVCKGARYNRETLEVKYKGKNIYDVLEMTVEEGLEFFSSIPKIKRKLQTLYDVGLGYVKIGQPATTLSGGEAQRVKLSTELSRRSTGKTVYILDEPTTGLHTADVHKLIEVLHRLVDNGNSVIVIEHNLDVIKTADWILDLGPEGGDEGGEIIAQGTPEQVAATEGSYTGQYLKKLLNDTEE